MTEPTEPGTSPAAEPDAGQERPDGSSVGRWGKSATGERLKGANALSLHVPEPLVRPGDEPNFSYIKVPPAGTMARPPIDVKAVDIKPHATGLLRVLDDDGNAVGEWAEDTPLALCVQGLRAMLKVRAYDERMLISQRQGKPHFIFSVPERRPLPVARGLHLSRATCVFRRIDNRVC